MQEIFDCRPQTNSHSPIINWHRLGPLNLKEQIDKGQIIFDDKVPIIEALHYKGQMDENGKYNGIGRYENDVVLEGQWKHGLLHGYG